MGTTSTFGVIVLAWLLGGGLWFGYRYGSVLRQNWNEPMWRYPVVIIESDDWGPSGPQDAAALRSLTAMLAQQRDSQNHPAVMTLGMLLAVPDRARIHEAGRQRYFRIGFDHKDFDDLRMTLSEGVQRGVFSLQLHGMEHYWPAAVLARAKQDKRVRDWLSREKGAVARHLPSDLQSRWTDASSLPSRDLSEQQIEAAVREECQAFIKAFGHPPKVAVPPTFVWNDKVERSWAEQGVELVIASHRRNIARGHYGELIEDVGGSICNGMRSRNGLWYLVRNCYFEPELGHQVDDKIAEIVATSRMARPVLVESHHFNYTGECARSAQNIDKLRTLLQGARRRLPDVRFQPTEALLASMGNGQDDLLKGRGLARVRPWLCRLRGIPGLEKRAWVSGVSLFALLLWCLASLATQPVEVEAN